MTPIWSRKRACFKADKVGSASFTKHVLQNWLGKLTGPIPLGVSSAKWRPWAPTILQRIVFIFFQSLTTCILQRLTYIILTSYDGSWRFHSLEILYIIHDDLRNVISHSLDTSCIQKKNKFHSLELICFMMSSRSSILQRSLVH